MFKLDQLFLMYLKGISVGVCLCDGMDETSTSRLFWEYLLTVNEMVGGVLNNTFLSF